MPLGNPEFVGWIVMTVGEINKVKTPRDSTLSQKWNNRQRIAVLGNRQTASGPGIIRPVHSGGGDVDKSCRAFARVTGHLGAKRLRAVDVVSVIIVSVFARTSVIEPPSIGLIPFDSCAETIFECDPA